jgi:hypothetical protein
MNEMNSDFTFVFDEDGKAHALKEGKVVASADSVEELETMVREAEAAFNTKMEAPDAKKTQEAQALGTEEEDEEETKEANAKAPIEPATKEAADDCNCWDGYERVPGTKPCEPGSCRKCGDHRSKEKESATHVVTPNGLKGRILGKTKDVWGDTVTVRFENGRIVQFPVSDNMRFATEEETAPESAVAALRERLEASVEGDRNSLLARINELKNIRREAAAAIVEGASHEDEQELDTIAIQAEVEMGQVVAALDHIASDDTEAFAPPVPQVVEQASLGEHDGTWLDETFSRMVNEANHTDYDKLMSEGPEAFIAELEAPALADAGVTREMAANFVRSKTAGANPDARVAFESAWIDRVESLRREELVNRKTKAKKEAAAESDHSNLPDDILFG